MLEVFGEQPASLGASIVENDGATTGGVTNTVLHALAKTLLQRESGGGREEGEQKGGGEGGEGEGTVEGI